MPPEAPQITLPPRSTPIDDFLVELQAARRKSEIDGRDFILTSRIIRWFRSPCNSERSATPHNSNAARVLHAIYGVEKFPRQRSRLLEHVNDDSNCWLRTFAVLLQMDHNGENMGKYIIRFQELGFLDQRLRFSVKADLEENVFPHLNILPSLAERLAVQFEHLQWQLYADTTLDEIDNQIYHSGQKKILPITHRVTLKEGDTSTVYMIEVPDECIPTTLAKKVKRKTHVTSKGDELQQMTLKVIKPKKSYELERKAYKALAGKEGILECFGWWSFTIDQEDTEYHILLEWGDHDLTEFFTCWPPPTTTDAILQFWEALLCIVSALGNIHQVDVDEPGSVQTYYGWHCDIKPANILFCQEGHQKGWKIADPGFARFVHADEAKEFNGLPVEEMHGGTTSYGAPEASSSKKTTVSRRFDVWSMGCVLSEAATWVILGHRGVQCFHHVRKCPTSGLDGFHDGNQRSKAVSDWHNYLRHSLRASDTVTEKVLAVVENHMLQGKPNDRYDAPDLSKRLSSIIMDARNAIPSGDKTSRYEIPAYFQSAIDEEQEEEAAEMQLRLKSGGSEKWREKYKSTAFLDATKEPLGRHNRDLDESESLAPPTIASDRLVPLSKRADTLPAESPQDFHSHAAGPSIRGETERPSSSDIMFATYRDARMILEGAGWKSGTLELPERAEDMSSSVSISPKGPKQRNSLYSRGISLLTPAGPQLNIPQARNVSNPVSLIRQRIGTWKRKSSGLSRTPSDTPARPYPTVLQSQSKPNDSVEQPISEDHRYDKFDSYFEGRDIAFLVDNGWSMREHWVWARDLLAVLAAFLYGQDDNGMDLYFTSRRQAVGTYKEPKQFINEMNQNIPQPPPSGQASSEPPSASRVPTIREAAPSRSNTIATSSSTSSNEYNPEDIRDILRGILDDWARTFNRTKRKLTLIILTDGVWRDVPEKWTVAEEIVTSLQRWQDRENLRKSLQSRGISIQFVRFGQDADAILELDRMDQKLTMRNGIKLPDIIDHEPADGNIYKMILGSLDERYDIDDEKPLSDAQSYVNSDTSTPTTLDSPVAFHSRGMQQSLGRPPSSQTFDVAGSRRNMAG